MSPIAPALRESTDLIVVHCSATPPYRDINAAEIARWHRARGWSDIGYHFVIRRDGTIEPGREATRQGAHARGVNNRSVGLCLVGGLDEAGEPADHFTAGQWVSLERLVGALKLIWPDAQVIGHNEVSAKACPSFDVQAWLESLASEVAAAEVTRSRDAMA